MKKKYTAALVLSMALLLTACGGTVPPSSSEETVELTVFAAASMQGTLDEVIALYKLDTPSVTITPTYDSSGTLKTQIEEGADCDLFISAAQKQMDALDISAKSGGEKNPEGLDFVASVTRIDLLENKVTLVVPAGNPKGVDSFDHLAALLKSGDILLAMGNSDVPVGQYTQKIFAHYGLDESVLSAAGVLTYGFNVKEVATQVSEATVDCGVIYATDAVSAGLSVVDTASKELCGQVIYPAAVLRGSAHPDEARTFLDFLLTEKALAVFKSVGFAPVSGN